MDLWLVAVQQLGGYGTPSLQSWSHSDFQLSELYKKNVGCKWFVVDANMKQAVASRLQAIDTNFICLGAT